MTAASGPDDRPGQPGKNEGEDAGLVGRRSVPSPSSPVGPPVIVDAAILAARDALKGQCSRPSRDAVEAVTAAWPHAGAAWLRWAAELVEEPYSTDIFPPITVDAAQEAMGALRTVGQTPDRYAAAGARLACSQIRRLADEIEGHP